MSTTQWYIVRYGLLKAFMEVYGYTEENEDAAILDYIQKIGVQYIYSQKHFEEVVDMASQYDLWCKLEPNTVLKFVDLKGYRKNIRTYISTKMGDPNWWVGPPEEGE